MISPQRHLFDIPGDVAYLNCAYMSPLMKPVMEAGRAGLQAKANPWTIAPPDFFSGSQSARARFASLINAAADDVAIIPSVSYGVATAARNLPVEAGQEIICLEDQFPSNIYGWRRLAGETGGQMRMIRRAEALDGNNACDWTSAVLGALSDKTAIVALPHCHWTDGALLDLIAIGARARTHGAALVLDLTQSCGALPFDVEEVQPDFAITATYKWLLGPYSLGFVYIAPQWRGGRPVEEGWIARQGSEDFGRLVEYQDAYQPGAQRFDMGERSNFHLMPMADAALTQILSWGVAAIRDTLGARTADIARRAEALGLSPLPEALRAPHYLGLRFPGGVPEGLAQRLAAAKVYVSVRGDSMRITPHLYNTDADVDRLFDALIQAL